MSKQDSRSEYDAHQETECMASDRNSWLAMSRENYQPCRRPSRWMNGWTASVLAGLILALPFIVKILK